MTEHDPYTYDISVEPAEPWMDRPVKVILTTHIRPGLSEASTFYLHPREARDLIDKLDEYFGRV